MGTRRVFGWDTETYLIGGAVTAPPLVCGSYAWGLPGVTSAQVAALCQRVRAKEFTKEQLIVGGDSKGVGWGVAAPQPFLNLLWQELNTPETLVAGHNVAFDLWVCTEEDGRLLPVVKEHLDAGTIRCTQVRDEMIDIANACFRSREVEDPETGEVSFPKVNYHLTELTDRRLGFKLDKSEDSWRLRYGELAGTPIADWPYEAVQYALLDALSTLGVYLSQEEQWDPITDEPRQTRAAWALEATGSRGLTIDPAAVETLSAALVVDVTATRAKLTEAGVYRPDGTKDMAGLRARVATAYEAQGLTVPMTAGGKKSGPQVGTSRSVLLESSDPTLVLLGEGGAKETLLTNFVGVLKKGYRQPLIAKYQPLVETNRASCQKPNVMQLPRYKGVRESIVARPGFALCSVDYDAAELHTLAQVCLDIVGYSHMAELYQANPDHDLHSDFAATMLGMSYAEFMAILKGSEGPARAKWAKAQRQAAKAANFGYPGGLGPVKFRRYAKDTYGLDLPMSECVALRAAWRKRWPEVVEFQEAVGAQLNGPEGLADFPLVRTGFLRGGCGYCNGCNFQFQGLAAAGAKDALYRAVRDGGAHGVFPVAFMHDEILSEVPIETQHDSAYWLADTMIGALSALCPDVPITAKPALMLAWSKDAEPTFDAQGRLVPWVPASPAAVAAPLTPTP
jgi:DNA polymerase-1